ncbi:hypothetical protein [Arthrobacter livingstonensis]|uniref:hypothetical protein n=1 Tax=Arthrobacter livingstonensis TaxID=670078 RepID=UPI0011B7C692|nr:hypothetical protein [Arthrobacter livingstonensis]
MCLALSGCITVPTEEPAPASTPAAGQPSYVDRLKATPVDKPTDGAASGTLPQFVTDSRNIACVFTTSRAGNLNQPWEPNNYGDAANAKAPTIPVVNCELASYPDPSAKDVTDDCAGTSIGYLGGTALLSPDKVGYGGCRAGATAVEASFGTDGTASEVMSQIPVLEQGRAMEAEGYRCAPMDDGVACANLATGLGFFAAAEKYELFGPGHKAASPASAATPKVTTAKAG